MAEELLVCNGSIMDGLDLDPVDWCGHPELNDDEWDKLWGELRDYDLLEMCPDLNCDFEEGPDIVNYSDTYITVTTKNEKTLASAKKWVREEIQTLLK